MTLQYSDFDNDKNIEISNNKNQSNQSNQSNQINQTNQTNQSTDTRPKQNRFNKTIKKSPQIADLYNKIHNNATEENESSNKMGQFVPLEPATLSRNEPVTEQSQPWTNNIEERINNYSENYYRGSVPQYSINNNIGTNEQLLNKLNYVIQLLEDQKDERTNYVSEELILYTFLGIFIIFIIDSFSKATKYIR